MNWKNHIGLLVVGSVALLLAIGAGVLLVMAQSKYSRINEMYRAQNSRYEELVRRDPFPSVENVKRAAEKLDGLRDYADQQRLSLQVGQINPEQMERADFPPLVERTLRGLWAEAGEAKVTLPVGFTFGFQRYIDGDIPAAQHIPRLVAQLKTVDALCRLLLDARITALQNIEREEFDRGPVREEVQEEEDTRRRRRRPAQAQEQQAAAGPQTKSTELYDVESFTLSFSARENALWDLLNLMAKSDMFVNVTGVEFTSTVTPVAKTSFKDYHIQRVREMMGGRATPLQQARIREIEERARHEAPPIDERVVAGREVVNAVIKCDVYRFRTDSMEGVKK